MKKGVEVEYWFLLFSLIFGVILIGVWQQKGTELASERMSELKILTLTQVKNILFTMQYAPLETEACASLKNCDKITIHSSYIEIWGPGGDYFEEEEYLSTSLVGDMELYEFNETSNEWQLLSPKGYTTTCSSEGKPLYLCFKKVEHNGEEVIHISRHII